MSISLSDGTNTIELGVTAGYALIGEPAIEPQGQVRLTRDVPYGRGGAYVDQMLYGGEARWTLPVKVSAATAADLAVRLQNLNAVLTAGGTLEDELAGAGTVTWTMAPSPPVYAQRESANVENRHVWRGDVVCYTDTFGIADLVTLTLDSGGAGSGAAVISLGNLAGDIPPQLVITVTRDWAGATNGIDHCWLGIVTGVIADYCYEAEAASGWTLCTEADAGPGGANNARKLNSSSYDDLDFGAPDEGRYRVMARARRTTSETGYLALSDMTSGEFSAVELTAAAYHSYDLGEFVADGVTHLVVWGKGSDFVYIDKLVLFPVESYASLDLTDYHPDSWTLDAVSSIEDVSTTVYPAVKWMTGEALCAPLTGAKLLVYVGDEDGSAECDYVVACGYRPLHVTWPDS